MIVDKAITALPYQGMNLHQYRSKKHSKLRLSGVKIFGIHTVNHQRRDHLVLLMAWVTPTHFKGASHSCNKYKYSTLPNYTVQKKAKILTQQAL